MKAYRTHVTITNPNRLILKDLPFRRGERVEILLLGRDAEDPAAREELRALLKETQSLHQAKAISDSEIAEEVAAYRASR